MTDDTAHPITVHARALAGDYPLLLAHAGHPAAVASGTIGRQPNVHAIPGGVQVHDFRREVRDTAYWYAEVVADARDLDDAELGDVARNLRLLADHADALDGAEVVTLMGEPACPVEHRRRVDGVWQADTPEQHLRCLAHRVRTHLEPPGAREFVGPCPTADPDTGQVCGLDLRALDHGPARCPAGHVHDTATVRDQSLTAARDHLLTIRQAADGSRMMFGRDVPAKTIEAWVVQKRLTTTRHTPDSPHLLRERDLAPLVHAMRRSR